MSNEKQVEEQMKEIVRDYYQTLFDSVEKSLPDMYDHLKGTYLQFCSELDSLNPSQFEELKNDLTSNNPELLFHLLNMPKSLENHKENEERKI